MVGVVKKVGKSRNVHPKVGKSSNFYNSVSLFCILISLTMLFSFVNFEADHLLF